MRPGVAVVTRELAGALSWEPPSRPSPLFILAWFAAGGLALAHWQSDRVLAMGLLALVSVGWLVIGMDHAVRRQLPAGSKRMGWLGLGMAAFFYFHGWSAFHDVASDDLRRLPVDLPRSVELRLIPEEEPVWRSRGNSRYGQAVCRVKEINYGQGWQAASGQVWARIDGESDGSSFYGQEVIAGGYLSRPGGPEGPGRLDFKQFLASRNIFHVFRTRVGDWKSTGNFEGWQLMAWAGSLQRFMVRVLRVGLDEAEPWPGLMAGMLFGYREGISTELMNAFTVTGTMHLFAVSGQNVGMVLWVFLVMMKSVGLVRWRWGWLVAPGLIMFCLSTGMESSASRALVMIVLVLGAWVLHRPVTPLNILGAAALLLWCWDPWQWHDVGFQLSFLVLLALLLGAGPVARALYIPLRPDVFIPRSRLPVWRVAIDRVAAAACSVFSASLVAWLGSLPLIAYHFGLIAPVTVLSNCLVVPLAGLVVVLALFAVMVGALWLPLAAVFNGMNAGVLAVMMAAIQFLAPMPGGHFYLNRDKPLGSDEFALTLLDGDRATPGILQLGDGTTVLLGGASAGDWKFRIDPARRFLGIERWNEVVLSQATARSLGGLPDLLAATPAEKLWTPSGRSRSSAFRRWQDWLSGPGSRYAERLSTLQQNDEILWGVEDSQAQEFYRLKVLWPPPDNEDWNAEDAGLVLRLDLAGTSLLLAGNAGARLESALLAGDLLSPLQSTSRKSPVSILVQAAHSKEINLSNEWIAFWSPEVIVRPPVGFYPDIAITPEKRLTMSQRGINWIGMSETGPLQIRASWKSPGRFEILVWSAQHNQFLPAHDTTQ